MSPLLPESSPRRCEERARFIILMVTSRKPERVTRVPERICERLPRELLCITGTAQGLLAAYKATTARTRSAIDFAFMN